MSSNGHFTAVIIIKIEIQFKQTFVKFESSMSKEIPTVSSIDDTADAPLLTPLTDLVTGMEQAIDDDRAIGVLLGNFIGQVRNLVRDAPLPVIGAREADQTLNKIRYAQFFLQALTEHKLKEAIILTQREFNLPNGYSFDVKMIVTVDDREENQK
ncbi:MAG: hypothetical protein ACMG6E_03570 [Candidatus Roizmanbacteria bacterium]